MTKDLDFQAQSKEWLQAKQSTPERLKSARAVLEDVRAGIPVFDAIKKHPIQAKGGGYVGKQMLVKVYRDLVEAGEMEEDKALLARIRMKPSRTLSGVTVITILTKPYPCPGKCIFCPDDVRMPKSYLPDEPGAMRALHHAFDPYDQVMARLKQLEAVGHPTDKIEMLILGGTWSSYRKDYQEWFLMEVYRALNGKVHDTLAEAQTYNETSEHRNVGLVIETRPDEIDQAEVQRLRYLGVTKVQVGAQSFNNDLLAMNKRGHTVEELLEAVNLLRAGGFKIVLHWMPNLLGATVQSDIEDFAKMWVDYCPDELKIYPTQLLAGTELYQHWEQGDYQPYDTDTLTNLLATIKPTIPRYCRINRVVRDIPSTNVIEGNKRTSLRMDLKKAMAAKGKHCQCVRCREVRGKKVELENLELNDLVYHAGGAEEHFISFDTPGDKLAGFLRLSLPGDNSPHTGMQDLDGAAIIREVHVYGQSLEVGASKDGAAQHIGLGTQLIEESERIANQKGFKRMAVIAAVGTREYYHKRGFKRSEHYMVKEL